MDTYGRNDPVHYSFWQQEKAMLPVISLLEDIGAHVQFVEDDLSLLQDTIFFTSRTYLPGGSLMQVENRYTSIPTLWKARLIITLSRHALASLTPETIRYSDLGQWLLSLDREQRCLWKLRNGAWSHVL